MKPLTEEDKIYAFKRATGGFAKSAERWTKRARTGLNDADLATALAYEIGTAGGSCGPGQMSIMYQGAGLKIWAAWESFNQFKTKPLFEGKSTIAMARQVYGIDNPDDAQLALL